MKERLIKGAETPVPCGNTTLSPGSISKTGFTRVGNVGACPITGVPSGGTIGEPISKFGTMFKKSLTDTFSNRGLPVTSSILPLPGDVRGTKDLSLAHAQMSGSTNESSHSSLGDLPASLDMATQSWL